MSIRKKTKKKTKRERKYIKDKKVTPPLFLSLGGGGDERSQLKHRRPKSSTNKQNYDPN